MYQEQRLEKILELLEERKQLSAKEMVPTISRSQRYHPSRLPLSLSQRQLVLQDPWWTLPLNKEPGPSYLDRSQKPTRKRPCYGSKRPCN